MDFKSAAEGFFNEIGLEVIPVSGLNRAYPLPEEVPSVEGLATPLQKIESLLELAQASAPSEELELESKKARGKNAGLW